ncbi:MAG: Transcription elongation factor GreA [Alphaproteobacteria bacterium MarineAlpha2_Bin1]|nr:MAG: Transcription elongation factor GreA [Alphaproteobacteria bacterium MarineAlpha2_Bin1]|tara:strand:- start:2708 stop:3181 length:474 start_codon:yes stop_codon:yes gene_type:complete
MAREPMTVRGYNKLKDELKLLKSEERPSVIKAIEEARAHGDLSENAEYHAAKEKQGLIEGRIVEIEDKLSRAEVFNPSELNSTNITFGATVTLIDEDTDEEVKYQIVGTDESDIKNGLLSITSPVGRALIGKSEGDNVEVKTPKGTKDYEIIKVEFI